MGATSVTGTGPGDVSGLNRGSEHMTLAVGNLLGPVIVAAGRHTMVGTTDVINIGTLGGAVGDYIVLATNDGSITNDDWSARLTALNQVTLEGSAADILQYAVVRITNNPGHAGSTL